MTAFTTRVRTRARPGHAHTLWYVIFNAPENCSAGACGDDDIFIDPTDHSAGFHAAQIARDACLGGWGNAGAVANPAGRLKRARPMTPPELLKRQLTSFQGACNPACEDTQPAVHVP